MRNCEKEEAVPAAAAGRCGWDEPLRAHAEHCSVCADVVRVSHLLQSEARTARAEAERRLPSPALIWWKAQILARWSAVDRAIRPIELWERIAWTVGAVGLLGLTAWHWAGIRRALRPLQATWTQLSSMGETPLFNPFLYLTGALFLFIAFLIFALWSLRAES